ncbi:ubiquinone biosynthesis monooxygenase Coq6 [Sporothrix schenckii 1099-18]|uniref:Ubiquinone biosynthesis monooxygenase COQ6, mitochondrial n=2 Tax=Sporothrix schenckii TaxID=29908 RepID=U7Q4X5_SPOS1|nr:ubiquinone biosynthesis monooxygenase Coq6 [Sporothrix schenckii 1099-18]ERT02075.1 ubiquinone biosynthesis monooxygenase COQ6 [Sporothrix schenckii ATCC 58251]KJR80721.1 ubiquinone biosynthesis monooxygenase Coq6 [Sporothrix schenckii 1099-18]
MLSLSMSARFVCTSCTRRFEQRVQQQVQHHQRRRWQSTASSPASSHDIYDIVCVGGGPAGLSLLTALRANPVTAGLRLALIEAQDLGRTRSYAPTSDQFANRCSSLTPASARFLNSIGAWPHLHRDRVQGYQEMQVWDGVTGARIAFDWPPGMVQSQSPDTGSTIAYMVENNNLTAGLLRRLDELGGVDVFDGSRVDSIGFGPEDQNGMDLSQWPAVQLAGQGADPKKSKTLLARLLVGADGANSPVRAFADIEARGWDYERHGVVATMLLEEGAGSLSGDAYKTAYQRFLPTGPVALLPLPGRFATLVWSTTPERAALLKSLAPEDFVAMVNAAFRLRPVDLTYMHGLTEGGQRDEVAWRLQTEATGTWTATDDAERLPATMVGVQPGSVASFPLKLRHADTYIGERVALVGDAAHTVHPLAGQGLNQGQGDAESLARTVAYAVAHGQDLGVRTSLEPYPSERYVANHVLMGVCDKLHKIYAIESGPLVPLRSLGLRAIDAMRPLKNFIMSQAASSGRTSV